MRNTGFDKSFPIILGTGPWTEFPVVVDGHSRFEAARSIGINDVSTAEKDFDTLGEAIAYAIHVQRDRRNLTDGEMLRAIQSLDNQRGRGGDRDTETGRFIPRAQGCANGEATKSSVKTARMLGVGARTVEKARTVNRDADEQTKEAIARGELSINKAYEQVREKKQFAALGTHQRTDDGLQTQIELHELAHIFPPMPDAEMESLVESIKTHGLVHPITTYQGKILDGKERYKACIIAGVKPRYTAYMGDDPLSFLNSQNLMRYHLPLEEKEAILAEVEKLQVLRK